MGGFAATTLFGATAVGVSAEISERTHKRTTTVVVSTTAGRNFAISDPVITTSL